MDGKKQDKKRMSINKYVVEKKDAEQQHLGDMFSEIEEVIANNPELTAKGAYGYLRSPIKSWTSDGISKYLTSRTPRSAIPQLVEIVEVEKFEKHKNPAILCKLEYNDQQTELWLNSVLMFTQKEYRTRVNKVLKEARKKYRKEVNEHQSLNE
jgi:hypothetical protein